MLKSLFRKLTVFVVALVMFAGLSVTAYSAEPEILSGMVAVVEDGIILDSEIGELVVKKGPLYEKIKGLDGNLITVEGIVSETENGTLELKVSKIVE